MELSLREIQGEITKWGLQQFGPGNISHYEGDPGYKTPMGSIIQLCGAFTELAEIMRPMIEMHQGRWKKEVDDDWRAKALREAFEDGAADLLIWLCHWAGLNHIDLQTVLNRVWHDKVQHRKRNDWEKIKAQEDPSYMIPWEKGHRESLGIARKQLEACTPGPEDPPATTPGRAFTPPDSYRHSCCEAMAPQEDNRPKPAGECSSCKTKFSDRTPKFCPECGFHLWELHCNLLNKES